MQSLVITSWVLALTLVITVSEGVPLLPRVAERGGSTPLGSSSNNILDTHRGSRQAHSINKRNAWWSKKSVPFQPMSAFNLELQGLDESRDAQDILGCYADQCVTDLVWCAREAQSKPEFLQCQLQHRLCLTRCQSPGGSRSSRD